MMISFFADLIKYRKKVVKQKKWMEKFVAIKPQYAINPNWMMSTNLSIWLTEMEEIYGKRYCPCFEPSSDESLNNKMLCPCKFIDEEIEKYGTCHCALFDPSDLGKEGWAKSSKRLQSEYRVRLDYENGILLRRSNMILQ